MLGPGWNSPVQKKSGPPERFKAQAGRWFFLIGAGALSPGVFFPFAGGLCLLFGRLFKGAGVALLRHIG